MSRQFITQYYNELHRIQRFSGSRNEDTIKGAFVNLINALARPKNLELVREVTIESRLGTKIRPDGILRNILQLDYGYWESKDSKDNLVTEIERKLNQGYPDNNILFEDTRTAILLQQQQKITISMDNPEALLKILNLFINYERPEVTKFNHAIIHFGTDLPVILESLRNMIESAAQNNPQFIEKCSEFLKICQDSINPNLNLHDIREMLIQHILTEDIFISIFNNAAYHRENNIAQSIYEVERTFFLGKTKQDLLYAIRPYYNTIKARANELVSHAEKQKFLKIIYENFYKFYNPKTADKFGIVYTPNEIVDFMISGTDFLLEKYFGKTLGSKGVEILDPCIGTGTFITQLIDYIPTHQLPYKYAHEIHANEIALLPYYVANLNIEAVYQAKMGDFKPFTHLCFMDTLDNINALQYSGKQNEMFGAISLENVERIKKQNERVISVIIGNPPYNANQPNENDNNKNREYFADIKKKTGGVDGRIKDTYVMASTAQKTKQYDMYKRFIRWATDRISENGIICFICNRSFIDKRQDDGFRKIAAQEFDFIYIIDLGGDLRSDGTEANDNVFGIMLGVAMIWLGKHSAKSKTGKTPIYYYRFPVLPNKSAKLELIQQSTFVNIGFDRISPDKNGNWLNEGMQRDFDTFLPVCAKDVKLEKTDQAIFQLYSLGVSSNRDEWVVDFDINNLIAKIKYFVDKYNELLQNRDFSWNTAIKWSEALKNHFTKFIHISINTNLIIKIGYRPFVYRYYYAEKYLSDRLTNNHHAIFGENLNKYNKVMCFSVFGSNKPFHCLGSKYISDLHYTGDSQCLPLYRYEGLNQVENITDWGLAQFRGHYGDQQIEKENIFHYVYAVLHNPTYREKYEPNLKRDFPRIPFYDDFWQWEKWGKALIELHLNYESTPRYELIRKENPRKNAAMTPKVKLKADKVGGIIIIDEETTLVGVPPIAWEYQLGNRSAIEWVLDQYKEKTPRDPTLAEQFNTYRFADYKDAVIELLERVCTVSVETIKIIAKMQGVGNR